MWYAPILPTYSHAGKEFKLQDIFMWIFAAALRIPVKMTHLWPLKYPQADDKVNLLSTQETTQSTSLGLPYLMPL